MDGTCRTRAGNEKHKVKFLCDKLIWSHCSYVTRGSLPWRALADTVVNLLVP
jgi:hypothetical protein